MELRFSFIVPVYNVQKYLAHCVASIESQTIRDWEMILVDDGSTDNSGKLCDEFGKEDARIRVVHQENGGLGAARNTGIHAARGRYMAFIDSDDAIAEDYLETLLPILEQKDPDLLIFNFHSIEDKTGRTVFFRERLPVDQVFNVGADPSLLIISPSACNKVFQRDFWLKSDLWFIGKMRYEDLNLIPKLLLIAKEVYYLNSKPLYHYYLHQGSIMRSGKSLSNYHDRVRALEDMRMFFRASGAEERYQKELSFQFYLHAFYFFTRDDLYKGERRYLNRYRSYFLKEYPHGMHSEYLKTFSQKERLIALLLRFRLHGILLCLSACSRSLAKIKKGNVET